MREVSREVAQWLATEGAEEALASLVGRDLSDRSLMGLVMELRERFTAEQAGALIDQARLRQKGREKFGEAALRMLFVEEALQQASGRRIATYRAQRYRPYSHIADLGCGIGGDALALSEVAEDLLALDLDPVRLFFAGHNLRVAGGGARVTLERADWTGYAYPPNVQAAFADPGRRVEGRRVYSLHEIQPPIEQILEVQRRLPTLGVKVMPGVPDEEVPEHCEVEFISEAGTLKEAVLWFGELRRGSERVATVLDGETAHRMASDEPAPPVEVTPPGSYLWEPDPAVIRATLVAQLANELKATQLDEQIAYLTGDWLLATPFARVWPVLDHAPFNLKELNRRLRALGAQVVAVKKRGSPIEPETFRRRLRSGERGLPVTVFVTRHQDRPWMILCGEELQER